jgi:hypothetical protein
MIAETTHITCRQFFIATIITIHKTRIASFDLQYVCGKVQLKRMCCLEGKECDTLIVINSLIISPILRFESFCLILLQSLLLIMTATNSLKATTSAASVIIRKCTCV